jgi:hypothetical protein
MAVVTELSVRLGLVPIEVFSVRVNRGFRDLTPIRAGTGGRGHNRSPGTHEPRDARSPGTRSLTTRSVPARRLHWYSGKAHEPAGNVQALAAPGGVPLWVSDVLPGCTHDPSAARALVLPGARPT